MILKIPLKIIDSHRVSITISQMCLRYRKLKCASTTCPWPVFYKNLNLLPKGAKISLKVIFILKTRLFIDTETKSTIFRFYIRVSVCKIPILKSLWKCVQIRNVFYQNRFSKIWGNMIFFIRLGEQREADNLSVV